MTPTSATGANLRHRRSQGFSLVELLIVLTILSLAAAVVVVAVPDPRPSLQREAERLAARIERAQDAAVLENRAISVELARSGYRFSVRRDGRWTPLAQRTFAETAWEPGTRVALGDGGRQRIVLDPVGGAEPVVIALGRDGDQRWVALDAAGETVVSAHAPN